MGVPVFPEDRYGDKYMGGAKLSKCRDYRYTLWRFWDLSRPMVTWIGLNPSTADETHNDPTIRRVIDFSREWGFGGMYMLNLFAYRTTDPLKLLSVDYPVGQRNNQFLCIVPKFCKLTIAAWGQDGSYYNRAHTVTQMLRARGIKLMCMGITNKGNPRHPLYLQKTVQPEPFIERPKGWIPTRMTIR